MALFQLHGEGGLLAKATYRRSELVAITDAIRETLLFVNDREDELGEHQKAGVKRLHDYWMEIENFLSETEDEVEDFLPAVTGTHTTHDD